MLQVFVEGSHKLNTVKSKPNFDFDLVGYIKEGLLCIWC